MENDTYKTIAHETPESLFKEKGSKFFGYAYPFDNEENLKSILENLRKIHPHARHFCYAYQIGTTNPKYRANDDGEPNNTAGTPIYGQIQSNNLTNILIVVVRIFGGTKLGVGGLISAYKNSAAITLEQAEIIEKTIDQHFEIKLDYIHLNKVMRIIKEKKINIIQQDTFVDPETNNPICQIQISIRQKHAEMVSEAFQELYEVKLKTL